MEIKHRFTGNVLFACDASNMKDTLLAAVKSGADLYGANLYEANLTGANLTGADLTRANLYGANLYEANLTGANLTGADLTRANLTRADLTGANLTRANLYGANLTRANLTRADLTGANLTGANLTGAKNADLVIAQQNICAEGQIIAWKKLKDGVIARLAIPGNAKRLNSIGSRKCRAEFAMVLELYGADIGYDKHTGQLEYKAGKFVYPDKFDDSIYVECSHGIHFFLTRLEAENY